MVCYRMKKTRMKKMKKQRNQKYLAVVKELPEPYYRTELGSVSFIVSKIHLVCFVSMSEIDYIMITMLSALCAYRLKCQQKRNGKHIRRNLLRELMKKPERE